MYLKEYIELYGVMQTHLAKRLGISVENLRNIVLQRREPKIALALKIQEITDGKVTLNDLIIKK